MSITARSGRARAPQSDTTRSTSGRLWWLRCTAATTVRSVIALALRSSAQLQRERREVEVPRAMVRLAAERCSSSSTTSYAAPRPAWTVAGRQRGRVRGVEQPRPVGRGDVVEQRRRSSGRRRRRARPRERAHGVPAVDVDDVARPSTSSDRIVGPTQSRVSRRSAARTGHEQRRRRRDPRARQQRDRCEVVGACVTTTARIAVERDASRARLVQRVGAAVEQQRRRRGPTSYAVPRLGRGGSVHDAHVHHALASRRRAVPSRTTRISATAR